MEERVNITQVEIMGENYTLRSEDDPEYVAEIARYVDAKFREVKNTSPNSSYLRTVVLAALNIADELHKLKLQEAGGEKQISEQIDRMMAWLEKELSGDAGKR